MKLIGTRSIRIRNVDATLCVDMLGGPVVQFNQSDRFSAAPTGRDMPKQWHGAFISEKRSTAAEFVALIRLNCASAAVTVGRAECGWIAEAEGRRVTLCGDRVAVE